MINFINTSIGYKTKQKHKTLLSDVNLSAQEGELVVLIGVNGAGKSTLLKTLAKSLLPISGKVNIIGNNITNYNSKDFAKKLSFVPAENNRPENMSVKEFVSFGRFPYTGFAGLNSSNDEAVINKAINDVGVQNLAQKKITDISSGEFQKVLIARSATQETPVRGTK